MPSGSRAAPLTLLRAAGEVAAPTTLTLLLLAQALSSAGIPALGAASMAAAAGLASQGVVPLWAVLAAGILGAEIGGLAGWWIGSRLTRRGGDSSGPVATRVGKALAAGRRFSDRWGRLMVFMVPSWVCGALGMPAAQFARWHLLSAALWTVGAGLTAYGVGFAISGHDALPSAASIAAGVAALLAIGLLFRRRRRRA